VGNLLDFFALEPSSYSIATHLFVRLLGLIYLFAYFPFLFQIKGLIGANGIRPVASYLKAIQARTGPMRYFYVPTLLWFNTSNSALFLLIGCGMLFASLLLLDIYPALMLILLYLIHLSLTSAGQEFLSFGWETFLMEITLGGFFTIATEPLNTFGWIGLNVLLLRIYLQAGVSKLFSHDPNWRNLTAIWYHYLSQPLPNTLAWYFHKLPMGFHKASTCSMFFAELIVPLAIFSPAEVRLGVFLLFVGLQFFIWFTGNFSYLNHMTVVFCLILLHNRYLGALEGIVPAHEPSELLWRILISIGAIAFLGLQLICLIHTFYPARLFRRILSWVSPCHIAYPHGIFAIMTTKRYEIIVEGSDDGEQWREYQFFYKPGDLAWRPRRISPYQPRIDWQAWFLPFDNFEEQHWFQAFLGKILQGSPEVLKLLKFNPFPEKPPQFVRALMYDYEYTSFEERAKTGHWWKRTLIGEYAPALQLRKTS
jgi:hypothetical protein